MKNYYSITIPKPCHENWNSMTPKEKGRFCNICSKTVIDFTKMPIEDIQEFIHQNKNNRICGHFKQSQLDSINIVIPLQVLMLQKSFHKLFLLVLLIVMGTTLMNCTNKNGGKQKIDSIEIVNQKNYKIIDDTLGLSFANEIDSIQNKSCNSNSEKSSLGNTTDGELVIETVGEINIVEPPIEIDSIIVLDPPEIEGEIALGMIVIESHPQFKDTPQHLSVQEKQRYFSSRLSKLVTENFNTSVCLDVKGKQKIQTQFKIDKNGDIVDIKVKAPHIKLEQEAIRVIKLLPQFIPAMQRNKPIASIYSLPIIFQVEE